MTTDLHFKGNQYNILLSIFYVPLVLTGPPMNMLTKKFGAKFILPSAMIIFGSMAMLSAAATNFGGIVTTRWFLGMAESGFYPGVIFYLTTFYKRNELAGRLSIFYAASEVAGAFTGLIAFGVFRKLRILTCCQLPVSPNKAIADSVLPRDQVVTARVAISILN
jgi:MFS family permease